VNKLILTLALNPSIEKTAVIDGFEINDSNSIQDYRLTLGQGAIYSATIIKLLQGDPYVIGFAGGIGGRYIKNYMDKRKIKSDLIWKDCETRSILTIIDSINATKTKLIDNTFFYDTYDFKNIKYKFHKHIKLADTIIISQSNEDSDISSKIVDELLLSSKENHSKVIVSLEGVQLRKSFNRSPYAVVINKEDLPELEEEFGEDMEENLEIFRQMIIRNKIKYILYDDHKSLYLVAKNKIGKVNYISKHEESEQYKNKDFIVGALAVCTSRKYEMEKALRVIGATKQAVNLDNYPEICTRKEIDIIAHKMKFVEIYNHKFSQYVTS
jgi:1-phosphofructokinase